MEHSEARPTPDPVREWNARLLAAVAGLLLFEILSGLAIFLLPFSVPGQFIVLVHTAAGLAFILPYAWYQARHLCVWQDYPWTHVKVLGYFAFASTAACSLSGLLLTFQTVFGNRMEYFWDMVHLVTTFAILAAALPHVLLVLVRRQASDAATVLRAAQRRFLSVSLGIASVLLALPILAAIGYRPSAFYNEFPADYSWKFGPDKPFAPSLVKTASGGAYDPRSLAESRGCGTSGCHEEIYAEWLPSAHRYASMDPGFQKIQRLMADNNGPESTRYCAGCHDPIALFSGNKNLYNEDLTSYGADEGVSCTVCHSIVRTDVQGNANYTIDQPSYYAFQLSSNSIGKWTSDFLIRAYPAQHVRSFTRDLYKTPEYCAACHKQFIDEQINRVGWVQLQNQYDNWRKSRWHSESDPSKTITCRECHMRLMPSSGDPASGDVQDGYRHQEDGHHRSHRFIAANQFIPAVLKLPGHHAQLRFTEEWLRGETVVPEIADRWSMGPAVPIQILSPAEVTPGSTVTVKVVVTNNKVGHDFPTGPLDIIQSWVDLRVTGPKGEEVYRSGHLDDKHFIQPGSFIFKAEGIDRYGNLIDRHNLWEMVGARFRRSLFPGFSDTASYEFPCPGLSVGPDSDAARIPAASAQTFEFDAPASSIPLTLRVEAVLRYRKIDQFLLNVLFGETSGVTAAVTDVSEAQADIRVQPPPSISRSP